MRNPSWQRSRFRRAADTLTEAASFGYTAKLEISEASTISGLKTTADSANTAATTALTKAGNAKLEADAAKTEAADAESDVSDAEAELGKLGQREDDLASSLGATKSALGSVQTETARLQLGAGRHVTPEAKAKLKSLLRLKFSVGVVSEAAAEPETYRDELAAALIAAGMQVPPMSTHVCLNCSPGVEVVGLPTDPRRHMLAEALTAIGVRHVYELDSPNGALTVSVEYNGDVP